MAIFYNLFFLTIWIIIGVILVYSRAYLKYEDKEKIDKCYKERNELKHENDQLKHKIKELEKNIGELKKEVEKAKREIMEKNKYLSEDKVIIERLEEVKKLSDQISTILSEYDKNMIKHLLEEYKKWELYKINSDTNKKENKDSKKW